MTKPKRCTWRPRHRRLDGLYGGREHHEVSCKQNFVTFIPPLEITFCPYCGVKIEEGEPIPQTGVDHDQAKKA